MHELIWFSIPGAIGLITLRLAYPHMGENNPFLLVATAPILGFVLHQAYRTIFELRGGFESDKRPVIKLIRATLGSEAESEHRAFLIWETTFYSDKIPDGFREHNRNAWHYIMSFRAVFFVTLFCGLFLAGYWSFWSQQSKGGLWLVAYVAVALVFFLKSTLTYGSLTRQECSAFYAYFENFKEVSANIPSSVSPPS